MPSKKEKNKSTIHERILKYQKTVEGEAQKVRTEILREKITKNANLEFEEKSYRKFYKNNKGREYVDIDHINALKIPYDVLIVIALKNIGKSTGILYKVFEEIHKKGQKIFFLRTSKVEVQEALPIICAGDNCPFKVFLRKNGPSTIVHKKTGADCGIVKDFKTANMGSGGEFQGFAAIMYDECCPWDSNNNLREHHYLNWAAMASSVTRNKKDGIKIYCVGNLTKNRGLLDFYGINPEDKFKYIVRYDENNPENACRILYINCQDIYTGGLNNQIGAVQGMAAQYRHQLTNNTPHLENKLIVCDEGIWKDLEFSASFIIANNQGIEYVFTLKKTPIDETDVKAPRVYICKVTQFKSYTILEGKTYTDSPITANKQANIIYIPSLIKQKFLIYDKALNKKLKFYDVASEEFTQMLLKTIKAEDRASIGF